MLSWPSKQFLRAAAWLLNAFLVYSSRIAIFFARCGKGLSRDLLQYVADLILLKALLKPAAVFLLLAAQLWLVDLMVPEIALYLRSEWLLLSIDGHLLGADWGVLAPLSWSAMLLLTMTGVVWTLVHILASDDLD